jgi:hypothetical protein
MPRGKRTRGFVVAAALVFAAWAQSPQPQSNPSSTAPLPTEQVIRNLVRRNQQRAGALRHFENTRIYRLEYHGFPSDRQAQMKVRVEYTYPGKKEFTVLSQSGSGFMINHVLKKLLDGEQESGNQENQRRTALNEENYDFKMAGYESTPTSANYVFQVAPKTKNKFLYNGRIWVDARDFAVTRIEGEPAKNPSFWIRKTQVKHRYLKQGEFWLPAENQTVSFIRLGGRADLTIEYQHYEIDGEPGGESGADAASGAKSSQNASDPH